MEGAYTFEISIYACMIAYDVTTQNSIAWTVTTKRTLKKETRIIAFPCSVSLGMLTNKNKLRGP
jgi:hypothetical protein